MANKSRAAVYDVVFDREQDGRWIAEIPELPGVLAYGKSKKEAFARVEALALRVLADRIEQEKQVRPSVTFREQVA